MPLPWLLLCCLSNLTTIHDRGAKRVPPEVWNESLCSACLLVSASRLWLVTWHLGLFIVLTLGQIGFKARGDGLL